MEEHSPPRRTRMTAARRQESILRAATEVFGENGYRAAKVSDIASRVGVTEPVVFQNFGSKPALFAAALDYAAKQARASLEEAAATFGSADLLLAHVLGHPSPPNLPGAAGATGHGEPGTGFGMLFADAIALAADPGLAEVSGQALRALAEHLADIVRQGQEDGSVRPGLDPEAVAWLLMSVLAARPLRRAAMPAELEPRVAGLAVRMLKRGTGS